MTLDPAENYTKAELLADLRSLREKVRSLEHESNTRNVEHRSLKNAHDELERGIEERTRELKMANEVLRREIGERQKAETELRTLSARYIDLYENSPDMYLTVDPHTAKVTHCNQTLTTNLGYEKAEVIGQPLSFIYHPDCMDSVREAFDLFVRTGQVHDAQLQLQRKDQSKLEVSLNVSSVYDDDGNILYSRSVWRDNTERKKFDQELADQIEERRAAEVALQELTHKLEHRVATRTAELEKALNQLTETQAALSKANAQLELDVATQTEELHRTTEQLKIELIEREKAELARAALQEKVIRTQESLLQEVSTPLIPITQEVMVMPLIGTINTMRAQHTLEAALHGVAANQAKVLIMDVTGVTEINAAVALTLVNTAKAVRLLGAETVLTGIRPRVAQILTVHEVDLGGLVTKASLQNGIDFAMKNLRDPDGTFKRPNPFS